MTTSNSSNKNGPSTLADRALLGWHEQGMMFVRFGSCHEVSFPTKGNPRLESAAEEDVGRIEVSPYPAKKTPRVGSRTTAVVCGKTRGHPQWRRKIRCTGNFAGGLRKSHAVIPEKNFCP
jgi:hypothetical protein